MQLSISSSLCALAIDQYCLKGAFMVHEYNIYNYGSSQWKRGKTSCMQGLHQSVETTWEQELTYVTVLEEQLCLLDNNLPLLFPEPPVSADCYNSSFRSCTEEKRIINQLTQELQHSCWESHSHVWF